MQALRRLHPTRGQHRRSPSAPPGTFTFFRLKCHIFLDPRVRLSVPCSTRLAVRFCEEPTSSSKPSNSEHKPQPRIAQRPIPNHELITRLTSSLRTNGRSEILEPFRPFRTRRVRGYLTQSIQTR